MSLLESACHIAIIETIKESNPCTEFGPAARAKLEALEAAVLYLLGESAFRDGDD